MNGKVVQLRQGKELVLQSDADPVALARELNRYGEVAVVDLDAALGRGNNRDLIEQICRVADVRVGGGIRDVEIGKSFLRAGAKSIVVGTAAEPQFLENFPASRVIVALDHVDGTVVDKGWQQSTGESVMDRAQRLAPMCGGFLVTFVKTEGMLQGLPIDTMKADLLALQKPITVAGGIATSAEIAQISGDGFDVQVGMALYQGKVDPAETVVSCVFAGREEDALIPTVVQDPSGQVLMVAYSNRDSLYQALTKGRGVYFSRSRNEIWEKGLTSGNKQTLISCRTDCDRDALVFRVQQLGPACHTGAYSCFDQTRETKAFSVPTLFDTLKDRKAKPTAKSFSGKLFADREMLLSKIREEAEEVCTYSSRENLRWEIADVLYFLSVLAVDEGISWSEIEAELGARSR